MNDKRMETHIPVESAIPAKRKLWNLEDSELTVLKEVTGQLRKFNFNWGSASYTLLGVAATDLVSTLFYHAGIEDVNVVIVTIGYVAGVALLFTAWMAYKLQQSFAGGTIDSAIDTLQKTINRIETYNIWADLPSEEHKTDKPEFGISLSQAKTSIFDNLADKKWDKES